MAKKFRWVLRDCEACGKQYADHERYSGIFKRWESRSHYCAACLMNADMQQRYKAIAAARARWQKRVHGELSARARLLAAEARAVGSKAPDPPPAPPQSP
jgi:hypothetical protein